MQLPIDRSKQPSLGPSPSIKLRKPKTFELKNGLKVLVVENHKLPKVAVSIKIDNKPHTKGTIKGVENLMGTLLGNGSKNTSREAFTEEIDFLGARIGFGAQSASASALSKYFERIVTLLSDAIINPNFTEETLNKERNKAIEAIKSGEKSTETVSQRIRNVLTYTTNHPFGEYTTPSSLKNITLDDITTYYNQYYTPQNTYLVVVGDISFEQAQKVITKHFSNWPSVTPPPSNFPLPKDVPSTVINLVNMEHAVQTELTVTNTVNLRLNSPDFHAILIANYIFGGAFNSYLNMNLRETNGFTYGAQSIVGKNKYSPSTFRATTKIRSDITHKAIVEILKEIARINTTLAEESTLEIAKAKFLGNFIMSTERPQTVARQALNILTEDLPENFYETFIAKINAITAEDIQRVAQKYFKLNNLRIIVVGNAKAMNLEGIEFNGTPLPVQSFDTYGTLIE